MDLLNNNLKRKKKKHHWPIVRKGSYEIIETYPIKLCRTTPQSHVGISQKHWIISGFLKLFSPKKKKKEENFIKKKKINKRISKIITWTYESERKKV